MKKIKIIIAALIIGSLGFVGCDKGFEELNKNPNQPTKVPSNLLLPDIQRYTGNYLYSTFVGSDMGSCWSQQWAKVNYEDEERYKVRASIIEGYCWKGMYADVIADAKAMEKLALEENNRLTRGVALVMQAYGFSLVTEWFGDVPFSEAGMGGDANFSPKYDTQQDVYVGIFSMLDTANVCLASGDGTLDAVTDLMYGGNHLAWQKFANTLKFRLLMRVSGKVDVKIQLAEVLTRPVFTSSTDDAKLNYLSSYPNANPMFESLVYGSRFEYKINSKMVAVLNDLNDPRLEVYCEPNNSGEYRGKPAGINEVPNDEYNYDNVSAIGSLYTEATFPGLFMTYSEFMFLKAEAAKNQLIIGSETAAESFYEAGIFANLAFNGLADQYVAYMTHTGVPYNSTTALQQIAEQKWIALFSQGTESWTEWRRTGYPVLLPAIDAVISEIPSRLIYPGIEQSVNSAAYNAAVAVQGADLLTTKFWWLK